MSWWDTSNLSKIASSALKTAQKQIDNVLEIGETGEQGASRSSYGGSDLAFDPLMAVDDFQWAAGASASKPKPKKTEPPEPLEEAASIDRDERQPSPLPPREEESQKEEQGASEEPESDDFNSWKPWSMDDNDRTEDIEEDIEESKDAATKDKLIGQAAEKADSAISRHDEMHFEESSDVDKAKDATEEVLEEETESCDTKIEDSAEVESASNSDPTESTPSEVVPINPDDAISHDPMKNVEICDTEPSVEVTEPLTIDVNTDVRDLDSPKCMDIGEDTRVESDRVASSEIEVEQESEVKEVADEDKPETSLKLIEEDGLDSPPNVPSEPSETDESGHESPVLDDTSMDGWDESKLRNIKCDLVEVECDPILSDSEMLSSTNDMTLTQDSVSSGTDILNQSRETGTETDNSTETLKDYEEDETKNQDSGNGAEKMDSLEVMNQSTASSDCSSSFVKCTAEDIACSEARDCDRFSDKSELVKIDSGHTSCDERDEIDTTTSSDIEIISCSNSESLRALDSSPFRHAFSGKTHGLGHSQTHKRNDSNSSSSGHSKYSDQDQLSPGRDDPDQPILLSTRIKKSSGPFVITGSTSHDDKSEKMKMKQMENENMIQKLAQMKEVLEARENKLLELSQETIRLTEVNDELQSKLHQTEEALKNETSDLNAITQEFSSRFREAEKKLQAANKAKDEYKQKLADTEMALAKTHEHSKLRQQVEEKDEQISELMAEGEKLSKQQLQSNNTIKKLRSKEKELESTIKTQEKKLDEQKSELEKLKHLSNNLETMSGKQADIITSLTDAIKQVETENARLTSESEDQTEKIRSMQAALDSSYKNIHELNKSMAIRESEVEEMILKVKKEAEDTMTRSQETINSRARSYTADLEQQVKDLQENLALEEKDRQKMEDILRREIADLQIRLQDTESNHEDVTHAVTSSTRPLLRQIETLQSTYTAQTAAWEKMERSLNDQLVDTQKQCQGLIDRAKLSEELRTDSQSRVTALERTVDALQKDKARLSAEVETLRTTASIVEDTKQREAAKVELMKTSLLQEINQLKRDKVNLSNQLDTERRKFETEKKKMVLAHELAAEKEKVPSQSPSPIFSTQSSRDSDIPVAVLPPLRQEEVLEHTLMTPTGSRLSLYESLRQNGPANILENLQSQLKQKEGELSLLQGEIVELEETRESMARELVLLTTRNHELEDQLSGFNDLQHLHKDLSSRYNALLQMYGEKVEEMQELQMDLDDVKDMYKAQIEELLKK